MSLNPSEDDETYLDIIANHFNYDHTTFLPPKACSIVVSKADFKYLDSTYQPYP